MLNIHLRLPIQHKGANIKASKQYQMFGNGEVLAISLHCFYAFGCKAQVQPLKRHWNITPTPAKFSRWRLPSKLIMSVPKDMTGKWIQNVAEVRVPLKLGFFFWFPGAVLSATHRPVPLPFRHAGNAYHLLQVHVYILLQIRITHVQLYICCILWVPHHCAFSWKPF